ncbi:MAG: MlaD family protein [Victivallaceae bacterium]
MGKSQHFLQGLFVIGALALLGAMLFFFGLSNLFVRKAHLVSLFGESVQGLAVGSPVKYKGVTIGDVREISIRVEDKLIRVDMYVELKAFSNAKDNMRPYRNQYEFREFLEKEISEGLRSRLEYAGITGLRYIDLDYYAPPGPWQSDALQPVSGANTLVVPSAPSAFKDIMKSLNTALERISKIRFEEISDSLLANLAELNRYMAAPDLKDAISHLRSMAINLDRTSESMNQVLSEKKLRETTELIDAALSSMRKVADQVSAELEKARLAESTAVFRRTTENVGNAAEMLTARRRELEITMQKLNETLDSARELLDMLNEDPSAVVRGRQQPPLNLQK